MKSPTLHMNSEVKNPSLNVSSLHIDAIFGNVQFVYMALVAVLYCPVW